MVMKLMPQRWFEKIPFSKLLNENKQIDNKFVSMALQEDQEGKGEKKEEDSF